MENIVSQNTDLTTLFIYAFKLKQQAHKEQLSFDAFNYIAIYLLETFKIDINPTESDIKYFAKQIKQIYKAYKDCANLGNSFVPNTPSRSRLAPLQKT